MIKRVKVVPPEVTNFHRTLQLDLLKKPKKKQVITYLSRHPKVKIDSALQCNEDTA